MLAPPSVGGGSSKSFVTIGICTEEVFLFCQLATVTWRCKQTTPQSHEFKVSTTKPNLI